MNVFRRCIVALCVILMFMDVNMNAQPVSLFKAISAPPFIPVSAIIPVPGSALNYTQIMFEHPPVEKAVRYQIHLFRINGKDTVQIRTLKDSTHVTFCDGLSFGESYCWKYQAFSKRNKVIFTSVVYGFSILPYANNFRARVILNDTTAGQGGLITFDYAQTILKRDGTPVWFLQQSSDREFNRENQIRDLRVSDAGTFTFVTEKNCFETTMDGRIVWKGPKLGDGHPYYVENYHHGFERLPGGNLLVMGNHTVKFDVGDSVVDARFGVVAEYDRKASLVWKWDSYNYFAKEDLLYKKIPSGKADVSTHLNAVEYADSGRTVYAGFRDMERIVKIDRASGKVVASYGKKMPSGEAQTGDGFFHKQHDITLLRNGNLAVFNNDSIGVPGKISSVVIFSQTDSINRASRIVMEFPCKWDDLTTGRSEKGGSIDELPNGNYLINMGSLHRCVEITPDKKIVWDVIEESFLADSNRSVSFHQYRSHWISSLYPCYYSVALHQPGKRDQFASLTIANEGDLSDSYIIEVGDGKSKWISVATTAALLPGQSANVIFRCADAEGKRYSHVRVLSARNRDFIRMYSIKGRKG